MPFECLEFSSSDHIAVMTLNRPDKLNALNAEIREEIYQVCDQIRDDDDIRAVIITGAGRGFCSGADVTGPPGARDESQNARLDNYGWVGKLASTIYELDKPTIAVMNGVAAGAGMSVALACDMRIGSAQSRFKTVFAERGLSPDTGMSYFLPRVVGYSRAVDLFFTSRNVGGEEAYRIGLLDRLVAPEDIMDCAYEVAAQMTALPPMALRSGKRVFQLNMSQDFHQALHTEHAGLIFAQRSPDDQKEQRAAFVEKRKPTFTGT